MFERTGETKKQKAQPIKRLIGQEKSFFIVTKIICETQAKKAKERSSSKEEHKVNALASGADEGRDKLR